MEVNIVLNKIVPGDLTLVELYHTENHYDKIVLNDVLDYIEPAHLVEELTKIRSKLTEQGVITLQSFDLYEISYGIVNDQISTIDYNNMTMNRKQILCVADLRFVFHTLKLKILNLHIDNYKYYIEAQKIGT